MARVVERHFEGGGVGYINDEFVIKTKTEVDKILERIAEITVQSIKERTAREFLQKQAV